MLNSLIHGEALFEILIEGGNPYADGPLSADEQALLQSEGLDVASLQALAIGRVVMGGRGVWALSSGQLVLLGQRSRTSVDRVALGDITHAEREQGRYGDTVRLQTRQGQWAMYGVDAERAGQMVDQLAAFSPAHA